MKSSKTVLLGITKGGTMSEKMGSSSLPPPPPSLSLSLTFVFIFGLAYQGKDIVFKFIIEYSSSLRDF
jgi:hypothetical protein